jgi:hypothetical protein
MKVINLEEAKEHLEQYAQECQTSPVAVTVDGRPAFEMLPIRTDDPDFLDRLLETDPAFQALVEDRRRQSQHGQVSSLESVRERLRHSPEQFFPPVPPIYAYILMSYYVDIAQVFGPAAMPPGVTDIAFPGPSWRGRVLGGQ